MIVFPALRKYGRISDPDVAPLIAHETAGRPYLPCYRGSSRLTPPQQCAEIAVLEWLEVQGLSADLEIDDAVPQKDGAVAVPVSWHAGQEVTGRLDARCESFEISRVDTCADLDEGPSASECWFVSRLIPH